MARSDIGHRRLLNQRVAGDRFDTPRDVVRWMGAVQAQDYRQAVWAIGLRAKSATLAEVEQAIADREIVWTWPMRRTLHFVPAEDAKWMVGLSASRSVAADRTRLKQLELDEPTLERAKLLFRAALQGGGRLSRTAMMKLLDDAGISTQGQRGYHVLWHAAQTGLICLGPMRDKEQTFVLLDEWVPRSRDLSRDEALAELAGRYVASHGPATVDDLARWAGLTLTDARSGLESAKTGLVSEMKGAKAYWSAEGAPERSAHGVSGAYLLPGFDEYLLGYKDRGDVLASEYASRVVPGGNGIFQPCIVSGGQVVGTWKRTIKKSGVDITLDPFAPGGVSKDDVRDAAQRFAAFLGLPLSSIEATGE